MSGTKTRRTDAALREQTAMPAKKTAAKKPEKASRAAAKKR